MKAVTCCRGALAVTDLPEPVPGPGHLLVEVRRAGICGSDLHLRTQADGLADLMREIERSDANFQNQRLPIDKGNLLLQRWDTVFTFKRDDE